MRGQAWLVAGVSLPPAACLVAGGPPDTAWEEDSIRYFPKERWVFYNDCCQMLDHYQQRYICVSGSRTERFQQAVEAVDTLLSRT
jgi:nicotinamide riboside kinase